MILFWFSWLFGVFLFLDSVVVCFMFMKNGEISDNSGKTRESRGELNEKS